MERESRLPHSPISVAQLVLFCVSCLLVVLAFLAQLVTAFIPRLLELLSNLDGDLISDASLDKLRHFFLTFNGAVGLLTFVLLLLSGFYCAAMMLRLALRFRFGL